MGVKAWMDAGREDFIVVDVRLPGPQRNSLIPGAVWIPQSQVGARMAELPRERLLVLYCWDTWCSLAASAAVELLDAGFQVRELHGGVRAWRTLKLPEDSLA
jgi:rhodanese-related sulfurtransferase